MSKHEENQTALEMAQAAYVPHVLTDIVMGLQLADLKRLHGLPGVGKTLHEAVGYVCAS